MSLPVHLVMFRHSTPKQLERTKTSVVPFPTDIEMVVRCSESLKMAIRGAIQNNRRFISRTEDRSYMQTRRMQYLRNPLTRRGNQESLPPDIS